MTAVTLIVTLSRVITSCGGTVSVTIRRSTLIIREMSGGTRKRTGPFAPVKRPSTKITPRSYCCTTRIAESARNTNKSTMAPSTDKTSRLMASLLTALQTGEGKRLPRQTLSWEWLRCFSCARLLVLVRCVMEPQAAYQDHGEKEREEEREHREDER